MLYQLSYSRNKKTPALTDFSGTLRSEYHWRCCVSRPSSAWGRVVPQCYGHGGVSICHVENNRMQNGREEEEVRCNPPSGLREIRAVEWSRPRLMSTSPLNTLLCLHAWPLNPVVFRESYLINSGRTHLRAGFPLRCFQRLSVPNIATLHVPLVRQQGDQRFVHSGPLVLGATPFNSPAPVADRDRTVSRRSEPSSRAALMGEQPNPWDLLQPQDATSRHRGAKPPRRYGLSGEISLLSPG